MSKLLKFYEKDGYYHLKNLEEQNRRLLEMSRKYTDIVEAFIRSTAGSEEVERYRKAMSLLKQEEEYQKAVDEHSI